jgi:hypothetical protein
VSGVDFVQWLREQLDAEAEEARAAAEEYGAVWTADEAMDSVSSDTGADVVDEPNTPHAFIAAHDPARALREIEAKRAVLKQYDDAVRVLTIYAEPEKATYSATEVTVLSKTLRLLASAYADRPGFRKEWAP